MFYTVYASLCLCCYDVTPHLALTYTKVHIRISSFCLKPKLKVGLIGLFLSQVEEIFTLSLSHLCNPQNRGYTHFRTGDKYGYTLPVFRNGKHRVWGLTAIALDHTLKLVVPP